MIGSGPFPKAAPAVFPLPGHRTMAQVMRAEEAERQRTMRLNPPSYPLTDYGSPFAVRRSA